MSHRVVLALSAATVSLALATTAAPAVAATACTNATADTIQVTTGVERYSVVLANPPPTRLQVSFDAPGKHRELEWDPAVRRNLEQQISLEAATWNVTVSAEVTILQQGAGTVVLVTKFCNLKKNAADFTIASDMNAVVANASVGGAMSAETRQLDWASPALTFTKVGLPAIAQLEFSADVARTSDVRGFGSVAPAALTEVLSLLAEIAVERAKAGALELVRDKLVTPLCGQAGDLSGAKLTLEGLGLAGPPGSSGNAALPRTCTLLHQLRLEDALAAGKPLVRALRDDLRFTVAPALVRSKIQSLDDTTQKVVLAGLDLVNHLFDGSALEQQFPILALTLFDAVSQGLSAADFAKAKDLLCTGRLAMAAVKMCSSEGCSLARVEDFLRAPESYVAEDKVVPFDACWKSNKFDFTGDRSRLRNLVLEALALVRPVADATSNRGRAIAITRLVFDLVIEHAEPTTAGEEDKLKAKLTAIRDVIVALLEEDYALALANAVRFAQSLKGQAGVTISVPAKVLQLVGTVVAYVKVYNETKDSDPAAAREARKSALVSLIDAATDRGGRGSDFVVSLGANVGIGAVRTYQRATDAAGYADPVDRLALRVPLGLSLQWLPEGEDGEDRCMRNDNLGWHLGLSLADLGQFLAADENGAVDDVRWSNFVAPGIEAGVLFGTPSRLGTLTAWAVYAPALFAGTRTIANGEGTDDDELAEVQGAWRVGVTLGYYVPFFDFN